MAHLYIEWNKSMAHLYIEGNISVLAKRFENMNHLIQPLSARGNTMTSYHEIADYNPGNLIQIKLRTSTLNKFTPVICSFCRNKNVSHLPGSTS